MNGLNRAELLGRLAFDPDLRYTGQGTAYCRLRVATSRMASWAYMSLAGWALRLVVWAGGVLRGRHRNRWCASAWIWDLK